MNMLLLTGLSLGLSLSILSANNFYADKVTTSSVNNVNKQIVYNMPDNGVGIKYANSGIEMTRAEKESAGISGIARYEDMAKNWLKKIL